MKVKQLKKLIEKLEDEAEVYVCGYPNIDIDYGEVFQGDLSLTPKAILVPDDSLTLNKERK